MHAGRRALAWRAGEDQFALEQTYQLLMFLGRPPSQDVDSVLKSVGY
ncbi:hypothetical protein ACNFH5_21550 [Pseudomonas sp. NY15435]